MTKKLLFILLLSTKMYGCARFLTEQWEKEQTQSEPRSGRMDWWAPQNEFAAEHIRKCEALRDAKDNHQTEESGTIAPLDQTTMNKLLHLTAAAGKLEAVQHLLKIGAPINGRDEDGLTPLMKATKSNRLAIVKVLLEAGADMNIYSDYCRVCDAAAYGDYPPNWRGPRERVTPPPHKCRQVTTAPLIAKFGRHTEIENLFEEYKSRSTNKKLEETKPQALITDFWKPISYRTPLP
jgi:hypothetical protein